MNNHLTLTHQRVSLSFELAKRWFHWSHGQSSFYGAAENASVLLLAFHIYVSDLSVEKIEELLNLSFGGTEEGYDQPA